MPVNIQRREWDSSIEFEGPVTVTFAADVKNALVECLSFGRDLELNLERTGEIDVTIMQLILVAARESVARGLKISGRASATAARNLRDAGFLDAPGFPPFVIEECEGTSPAAGNG